MTRTPLPNGLVYSSSNQPKLEIYQNRTRYFYKASFYGLFSFYAALEPHEKEVLENWWAQYQEAKRVAGQLDKIESVWQQAIPISNEEVSSVQVLPSFPKMTVEFVRLIRLYQYYCKGLEEKNKSSLEVSVLLFFHPELNMVRWVLPDQVVSGAHVGWDVSKNKKLAFLTGETFTLEELRKQGWVHVGTSHSHNTLGCTWSEGTKSCDKENICGTFIESRPTGVHLLIYSMRGYESDETLDFEILVSGNANGDWSHVGDSTGALAPSEGLNSIIDFEGLSKLDWLEIDFDESITSLARLQAYTYTRPKTYGGISQGSWGQYYEYYYGGPGQNYYGFNQPAKKLPPVKPHRQELLEESKIYNIDAIRHHVPQLTMEICADHVAEFLEDIRLHLPGVTTETIVLALLEKSDVLCEGLVDIGIYDAYEQSSDPNILDVLTYDGDEVEEDLVETEDAILDDPFLYREYLVEGDLPSEIFEFYGE